MSDVSIVIRVITQKIGENKVRMFKKIFSFASNAATGNLGAHYAWKDFHERRLRQLLLNYEYNNDHINVFYVFLKFGKFAYAEKKSYENTFEPYSGYGFSSIPLRKVLSADQEINLETTISFYRCPESKRFVIFVMSREGAIHFQPPLITKVVEARRLAEITAEERMLPTSYFLHKFSTAIGIFYPRLQCDAACNILTSSESSWEKIFSNFNRRLPPATIGNLEILNQYFSNEKSEVRYSDTSMWLE
jgi:hypothetical protein